MKLLPAFCIIILLGLFILFRSAQRQNLFYEVKTNNSAFPLPYELPDFKGRSESSFDWNMYLGDATSDADRTFRARRAPIEFSFSISGSGTGSNMDDVIAFGLAADEFKAKCDDLIRRYRNKLEGDPELKILNEFVDHSEAAIEKQVQLVGGSWEGSGRRVAFPQAQMYAYINFHKNLKALGESLYLQDLPP